MNSYLYQPASVPVLETTIGEYLQRCVRQYTRDMAVIDDAASCQWTYGALSQRVEEWRLRLRDMRVRSGQRVALMAENGAEWIAAFLACVCDGIVVVGMSTGLDAETVRERMHVTGARYLLTRSDLLESPRFRLAPHSATCESFQVLECLDMRAVEHAKGTLAEATLHARSPCMICFSSGTTGAAKAITLTHRNLINNAVLVGEALHYRPGLSVLSLFPFFVAGGTVIGVLAALAFGASIICPRSIKAREVVVEALNDHKPDCFLASPRLVEQVFDGAEQHLKFLRTLNSIGMGSTPCVPKFINRLLLRFRVPSVSLIYGMTETGPVTFVHTVAKPLDSEIAPVGRLMPNLEAKVIDDDGQIVPLGVAGELCIKGHATMAGYWNNPQATQAMIDAAGWLRTGDLAHFNEQGLCYVHGRKSDQIESDGCRLHPSVLERVFLAHHGVQNAQVVCLPDRRLAAWIKPEPNSCTTSEDLAAYYAARARMLPAISYIRIVEGYPLNDTGKVQRTVIVEQTSAALGL